MSIFSLGRRSPKLQIAFFDVQSATVGIPLSSVVAREPWSGSGLHVSSASPATGYTSHSGKLVPVYDLSTSLGLPERQVGSEEVAVVSTSQGYVAIQIDGFSDIQQGHEGAKHLSAEELLEMLITPAHGN